MFNICDNQSISVASAITNSITLRRSLNAAGAAQWHQLNLILSSTPLSHEHDEISWALARSGTYSVSSMYAHLSQGATFPIYRDIWEAKLPLKIKVFSWQLALDKLHSGLQIASRFGPSDGRCLLCGDLENASHIFFTCSMARFAWSSMRQTLGRDWAPTSFAQFFSILTNLTGQFCRLLWVLFLAQSWALWHVRNKLAIEKKVIHHPTDILFKTLIFLQLWIPTLKSSDQEGVRWLISELKQTHLACRPSTS